MTRVWVLVAGLVAAGLASAEPTASAGTPVPANNAPKRTVKSLQDEGRGILELLQGQLKDIESRYNEAKNANNASKMTCLEEPRTSLRGVVRSAEDLSRALDALVVLNEEAEDKLKSILLARDQAKKIKETVETCEVKAGSGNDNNGTLQVTEPGDVNKAPQPNQGSSGTMPSVNTPPASPT